MCAWQAVGQASGHREEDTHGWLWLRVVFENAGRERGLLTLEDLLLCASSCKSWRFNLLAMLPPGAPCCEDPQPPRATKAMRVSMRMTSRACEFRACMRVALRDSDHHDRSL